MGCDGGTIPKRDELVRKKKKPEQKDKDSELSFRWRHCSLTQQPLRAPVVACGLGRLYNKDSIIEALLEKSELLESAKHVKNLKDLKDLKLTVNPEYKQSAEKGDAYVDRQASQYICPVIGLEMNGKFRFIFLWGCGCVMSERSLKEVKTNVCHKCQHSFTDEDVVILNASGDDLDLMKANMEVRQAKVKAEKKTKRKEKEGVPETSTAANETSKPIANGMNIEVKMKEIKEEDKGIIKPKNKANGLLPKADKRPASVSSGIENPVYKKTKMEYSVAKDPKATEVYKSLFTSHQKAQGQSKAHWITYNPFYN